MTILDRLLSGTVAVMVGLAFSFVPQMAAASPQQSLQNQVPAESASSSSSQTSASTPVSGHTETLPNSPGADRATSQLGAVADQNQPPVQPQPAGTAAARTVPTNGVAASRPAGAAIAPAKQRQRRSLLIKMGAVVGAGVALGTVMALSSGSPSRPPGAH
jgi:hypothetical protein